MLQRSSRRLILAVVLFTVGVSAAFAQAEKVYVTRAGEKQGQFSGEVVGVSDGDTISVMQNGRAVRVRLDGIDCPEQAQDFGQRAKQFTSSRVFGKKVVVDVRDVDRYGRLVARVYTDGEDVSLALVRAGFAWHYKQYSSDRMLADAENEARASRIGLWSQGTPVAPWQFRHPAATATPRGAGCSLRGCAVSRQPPQQGLSPARVCQLWLQELHARVQDARGCARSWIPAGRRLFELARTTRFHAQHEAGVSQASRVRDCCRRGSASLRMRRCPRAERSEQSDDSSGRWSASPSW